MPLILTLDNDNKFMLENLKDAQSLMEIIARAKPVKEAARYDYEQRRAFAKEYGSSLVHDESREDVISIAMCANEPVAPELFEKFKAEWEAKKPAKEAKADGDKPATTELANKAA
ncbi:hypothetical protein GCM10011369_23210 [Neiella marina]|uniref:Uncharacterized protein n=1 Tax=Neiella marina TaxID=508461 RepID=A0A8J2U5X2_9GAMM|nr:hypothetical protein [Neiella marina]GGA80633.1 hypothetical protein GCM10011369_23210 [Neiella marina]